MDDNQKYEAAFELATRKHDGQYRKGGAPYITHPVAVSQIVKIQGYGVDYQVTALFHDLLEDTDATETEIEEIGGKDVLEAVKLLTKTNGYVMAEYIDGIRANDIAFAVKAADRLHNLRSAVCANDEFKRKYILETINWYMDFSPEIGEAVHALAKTLSKPITDLHL